MANKILSELSNNRPLIIFAFWIIMSLCTIIRIGIKHIPGAVIAAWSLLTSMSVIFYVRFFMSENFVMQMTAMITSALVGIVGIIFGGIMAYKASRGKTAGTIMLEQLDSKCYRAIFLYAIKNIKEKEKVVSIIEKAEQKDISLPLECLYHYELYINAPKDKKEVAYKYFAATMKAASRYFKKDGTFGDFSWRDTFRPLRFGNVFLNILLWSSIASVFCIPMAIIDLQFKIALWAFCFAVTFFILYKFIKKDIVRYEVLLKEITEADNR